MPFILFCEICKTYLFLPSAIYLKDHEEEEVGISEPPELLKEVKGQEGENVVFGGLDGIVLE